MLRSLNFLLDALDSMMIAYGYLLWHEAQKKENTLLITTRCFSPITLPLTLNLVIKLETINLGSNGGIHSPSTDEKIRDLLVYEQG